MFPSDTDYETKVTLESGMTPLDEESPFHILLLGDWSGRESRSVSSAPKYQPIEIDRDNFDEVMKRLGIGLILDFQGNAENVLALDFNEIEDFHPDRLFQQVKLFDNLRDIRRRLVNADTFADAAREVRTWFSENENKDAIETEQQTSAEKTHEIYSAGLLDQILGQTDESVSTTGSQTTQFSELSAFVKNIVKPHLIHTDTEEQSKLLIIVDEVISDLMRRILHHPHFQALESAWRGAYLVVKRVETSSKLKIHILDVSKNELVNNLKTSDDLTDSQLYRTVAHVNTLQSKNEQWAVICANYSFSPNIDDIASLIRIAKISHNNNLPFISHLRAEIFGLNSFDEIENSDNLKFLGDSTAGKLWTTVRNIPEAAYIGLVLPRILIRLPYGKDTEPTETFSFEEFTDVIKHEQYLWANPVFANALLLAQTFSEYGWNISKNFFQNIDNLPLHTFKNEYGSISKPAAEILMTQSNFESILEQGLMPLISFNGTDRIRLGRLQSIAYPFSPLQGKWN
jgi:type VI secretion system protein ImpC